MPCRRSGRQTVAVLSVGDNPRPGQQRGGSVSQCVMLHTVVKELTSAHLVAAFQRWCGVEEQRVAVLPRQAATNGCQHRSAADDIAVPSSSSSSCTRHEDNCRRHHARQRVHGLTDHSAPNTPYPVTNGAATVNGWVNAKAVANGGGGGCGCELEVQAPPSASNGVVAACSQPAPTQQPSNNGTAQNQDGAHPLPPHSSHPSSPRCCCCRTGWGAGVEEEEEEKSGCVKGDEGSSPPVVLHYPLLYYWARVGAALGNELFYLTGMPFLLWTVDSAVVRQTALLWWAVMYVGQALKDYLGWPRPPSPPVVHLETAHLAEFAMPSTHAMAGTAIPLLLATLFLQRYQVPVAAVVCVAVTWCATTCLSRLYLGVHTVLDVLCGVLLALLLYLLLSPLIPIYDLFQQTHPLAPLLLLPASLALCTVCYPSGSRHSAKGDAVIITAVIAGVGLGSWLNYQLGWSQDRPLALPLPVPCPTFRGVGVAALQFVVGVAVVGVVKVAMKPVAVWLFCRVLGVRGSDLPHAGVTLGYRYTTYLCLGLCIVFVDPWLFTLGGFGRDGYYQEVV